MGNARRQWEHHAEAARAAKVTGCIEEMAWDAAVLYAHDRITALETALSDCLRHMKTAGDPEAVRACEAAEKLLRKAPARTEEVES